MNKKREKIPVNFVEGVREAIRLKLEAAYYQTILNRVTAHFIRIHTIYNEYLHAWAHFFQQMLNRIESGEPLEMF